MINETYSAFLQGFMPTISRPDVDLLDGLTTAIVVDQERLGNNPRSTLGTVTDVNAMLRILFSRLGEPHVGSPNAFSFNVPSVQGSGAILVQRGGAAATKKKATFTQLGGMCPGCDGMGRVSDIDLTELFDETKSLNDGAITVPGYVAGGWYVKLFAASGFFDPDKPIQDFTKLRDKGNTVLVVEHKPETIAIADHVVDLGPGAGTAGGQVCFEGTVDELRAADTLTGHHLNDRARLKDEVRTPTGHIEIRGANRHNLRDVDVGVPLGVLCVVTGVAGSGKTSLVHGSMPKDADVVVVGQGAIGGSRRSNPATYTGLLEPVRKAFGKANGVKPALFSANCEGACPACNGAGVIYTDLGMMQGVTTTCEECGGLRFQPEVLEHRLGGKDITEVLAMTVTEALKFFADGDARVPAAHKILVRLADVGLGYLTLGQPLTTLSGGERQRLKLAVHMADDGGVYVLDEPTTGLHLAQYVTP